MTDPVLFKAPLAIMTAADIEKAIEFVQREIDRCKTELATWELILADLTRKTTDAKVVEG